MNDRDERAFPVPAPGIRPGMSLRDWFAGQALAGMYAAGDDELAPGIAAAAAYRLADAMLKERAK